MTKIRQLFDSTRSIDRRIEKVINYETTNEQLLKQEISEYVTTKSISEHFDRLLDLFDRGMGDGSREVGVWVSGFYGSGKSSFTKYLGFAFDPTKSWTTNHSPSGWVTGSMTSFCAHILKQLRNGTPPRL